MENSMLLLKRLHDLESEIQAIKATIIKQKDPTLVDRFMRRPWNWILKNWGFCFFVLSLFFAAWTYAKYGVGYFESQKNTALKRQSSESYRRLGDSLMVYGEFEAAKGAYNRALKINDSNIEATRGVLKTEVFEPLEGQQYISPEIAETRITHLRNLMKIEERSGLLGLLGLRTAKIEREEGYLLDFFEGQLLQLKNERDEARASYERSVKKNPKFLFGYIAQAIMDYEEHNYTAAINTLEIAKGHHPTSARVLNSLGACYMLKGEFLKAAGYFSEALRTSPTLSTFLNASEAYRFQMEVDNARAVDEEALRRISDSNNENERFMADDIIFAFLPERKGEPPPPENRTVSNVDEKKMVLYYALALDHALNESFDKADQSFAEALRLDPEGKFHAFARNRILSLENLSLKQLPAQTRSWMNEKVTFLSTPN